MSWDGIGVLAVVPFTIKANKVLLTEQKARPVRCAVLESVEGGWVGWRCDDGMMVREGLVTMMEGLLMGSNLNGTE